MISGIVIAHNEEKYIKECLTALQNQTRKADEIIVVVHNSSDATAEIASSFKGVRVEILQTEERGPVFPRIRGVEVAKGDIIACIDGDTIARPDWLEKVIEPLEKNPEISGVGGMVWFKKSFGGNLAAIGFFILSKIFVPGWHFYFWGANFACRKSAYESCGGLKPLLNLREKLGLARWAEDCYLSLALEKTGKVVFQKTAIVDSYPSEEENHTPISGRTFEQGKDKKKLFRYFGK